MNVGHIELVLPVSHIWYFRGTPSRIGQMLEISQKRLEEVYFTKIVAAYDKKKDIWVASGEFGNMYDGNIPVNVSVDFDELTSEGSISPDMITDAYANLSEVQTDIKEYNQTLDSLKSLIIEERSKEKIDLETLSELYTQYFDALGIEAPIFENDGKLISDAEIEKLQKDYEAFKTKYGNINVEKLLSTELSEINFKFNEDNIDGEITVSTCEGYTESDLSENYTKITTTDGNCLYVYGNDEKLIILDFVNNICYTICNNTQQLQEIRKLNPSISITFLSKLMPPWRCSSTSPITSRTFLAISVALFIFLVMTLI